MGRFEDQLVKVDDGFRRVLGQVPIQNNPPLPSNWLQCEMLERFQILQSTTIAGGSRVLEVGTGGHAITTVPLAYCVGSQGRVVAVERERWTAFRQTVVTTGMQARILPVASDARHLPFLADSFTLSACVHGIRSLRSEANMVEIFREMLRVAPRALLAESLPLARTPAQRAHLAMYDLREEVFEATTGAKDDLHYLPRERLQAIVEQAGGAVEESRVLEVDLPHALAFLPREFVERVSEPHQRESLLRRWDAAEQLRREHGTDHPPVALIIAGRGY